MNVNKIGQFATRTARRAKATGEFVAREVSDAISNQVVKGKVKKVAPYAALCVGAFSLLGLMKNKKSDGKPGIIERKSSTLATAAFGLISAKKFFKNADVETLKGIYKYRNILNPKKTLHIIGVNKKTAVAFAASLAAVKLATLAGVKAVDCFAKGAFGDSKLDESSQG